MITPDSWQPQGAISLLFAPSTIPVAAFLFGQEPTSERAGLWLWYWASAGFGVLLTAIVMILLHRRGKLVRRSSEGVHAPVTTRRRLGAIAFLALAALFYAVVPATGQAVVWGASSGALMLFVAVANVFGYRDWRARRNG